MFSFEYIRVANINSGLYREYMILRVYGLGMIKPIGIYFDDEIFSPDRSGTV